MSDKRTALILSGLLLGCVLEYVLSGKREALMSCGPLFGSVLECVHERQEESFSIERFSSWLCFGLCA
jgi:hypothetical protein